MARRVYVAIAQAPGAVDVIDTASLTNAKTIPIKGNVHNTYVTPDGNYAVAGSIVGKNMTVIDTSTEEVAWVLDFDLGVRPMAFDRNPDGSTKRTFVQLTDFNGFAVVDFATHKEVTRVALPELGPGKAPVRVGGNASHGMAVTADGTTLIVNSRLNSAVYVYFAPRSEAGRHDGRSASLRTGSHSRPTARLHTSPSPGRISSQRSTSSR